jgi:hypothetical protein
MVIVIVHTFVPNEAVAKSIASVESLVVFNILEVVLSTTGYEATSLCIVKMWSYIFGAYIFHIYLLGPKPFNSLMLLVSAVTSCKHSIH